MYLLYTDEVNTDPEKSDFFVYAGVAIPGDHAGKVSAEIDSLRAQYGYRVEDILKFNTVERPKHISPVAHREIKRNVMEVAGRHDVRLFASFIYHKVAKNPEEARRKEINRICFHFDCFLRRQGDVGLVLIDTFQDDKLPSILREKFSVGLIGMPYSKTYRLERILGFHLACIGSSNFCSLVDIALGSLRYAVNVREDVSKQPVIQILLKQLEPLCLRTSISKKVDPLSLFFSPKSIKAPTYLKAYQALHKFLADAGLESAQTPSEHGW